MNAITSAAPVVAIINGKATTTSNQVADYFHKLHKNVIQKIEALKVDCPADWYALNFQPIKITVDLGMDRTRQDPAYQITRDGFTLLAMGFTGKQALQWKIRYIEAFNAMEAELIATPQKLEARILAMEASVAKIAKGACHPLLRPEQLDKDLATIESNLARMGQDVKWAAEKLAKMASLLIDNSAAIKERRALLG